MREVRGGIRCLSEVEDAENDEIDEIEDYYVLDEPQVILSSDEEDPDTSDSDASDEDMFDDSDEEDPADTGDEELDVSDKGKSSVREEETREAE
ncbi:hypothetical protein J4E89_007788 [Alternaria sp. Ai002NY15]|nr:hypothetical protein J4E89_007788 [Alternaria sp. Ai002NY15]